MLPKETNPRMKDKKKPRLHKIDSESSESSSESEEEVDETEEELNENKEVKLKKEKPKSLRQRETPEEKKLRKQQVFQNEII